MKYITCKRASVLFSTVLALLVAGTQSQTALVAQDQNFAPEDVVQMEAFTVKTDLGRYHDSTSATATKIPMDMKAVASSLSVLNNNALMDRNAVSLQDVYTYITGMNQVQPNSNGFTFRGFSSTGSFTQNIQFDGIMGTTSSKGALSTDNVERVEFLKGPNSVLYGQMKPGGLLNIVTKSPKAKKSTVVRTSFVTYAGDSYASFGSKVGLIGSFDTTGPIDQDKHWLYRLIVSGSDEKPFRKNAFTKTFYIYPQLTYKWSADTFLTVKGEDIQEKRHHDDFLVPIGNNAASVARFDTSYQEEFDVARDKGSAMSTSFQTRWNDNWTLRAQNRLAWNRNVTRNYATRGQKITTKTPIQDSYIQRSYTYTDNGHRYNFTDVNFYGNFGPENFTHTALAGLYGGREYFDNHRISNGPKQPTINILNPILGTVTGYPADGNGAFDIKQPLSTASWYVADQMKIANRLHVSLGTRYEQQISTAVDPVGNTIPYMHQFVSQQTSQAGAVYEINKTLSAYASWSQSFVPSDVTIVDAFGNSGFPSEKGKQYEAGFKFETEDRSFFASLAAYRIIRSNVAVGTGFQLPDGRAYFRVDGEQRSQGFELETNWLPIPNWQIQAGAAYVEATITDSVKNPQTIGLDLANAPRASANLWTRYNFASGTFKGFGTGLGVIYIGKQWAGNPAARPAYFPVAGWTRVDTAFFYKWRRFDIALDIKNIFDRKYILAAYNATALIPGEPRKITLSVTTRF
ncbi:MAG: TonB-dependent siderophore receptor [Opitutaceae bacterium]|nr:TonB-dependent siderophore receptor [Opitutaceae bacterium]